MATNDAAEPLVERLAVQRLAAPGILDRRTMERAHDRLSRLAGAHVLPRLERRMASAVTSTESLPLVRGSRSSERLTVAAADHAIAAAPSTRNGDAPAAQRQSERVAEPSSGPVMRQTLTTDRHVGEVTGPTESARAPALSFTRSQRSNPRAPSIAVSVAPGAIVQRTVETGSHMGAAFASNGLAAARHDAATTRPPSAAQTVTSPAPAISSPGAARGADESAESRVGLAFATSGPRGPIATTKHAVAAPTSHARVSYARDDSSQLLLRKSNESRSTLAATALPVATSLPTIRAASTPLVMRQASETVLSSPQSTLSSIPAADDGEETVVSPPSTGETERARASEANIDWIAEQVGNRLARRLEIERERMGVRRWRQVS